jgi:hypothetical protein
MTIYEDEWAFWDDIVGRYILKHAAIDHNVDKVINAASVHADLMVLERRKRKRVRLAAQGSSVAPEASQ